MYPYFSDLELILYRNAQKPRRTLTSTPAPKKQTVDETRIGDYAAMQPLSGVTYVGESYAVNGAGHGGYTRKEETEKTPPRSN